MTTVSNPVLSGFYPDPSICRVGTQYYLVNSTFAYFPGVSVMESSDLKHWKQIGSVLERKEQLPLDGCGHSEGIFAPTIRYYNGTFYMITTNISGGGNFVVTAKDPKGPWSDPYWLGEAAQGIDPSLFFDDDETCWYIGTRPNPDGVRYNGDWVIWIQRLDLETMQLIGESYNIWKGAMRDVIWPEGPHLLKKDGWYYVINAEGGTGPNHSICVARSRNITGPYENNLNNPILTHRHMGKEYPIACVGHGDFVESIEGDWYVVMLGTRPYKGKTVIGRETFIAKVEWEDGWPVINPGIGHLEDIVELNTTEEPDFATPIVTHFYTKKLPVNWMSLRGPREDFASLAEREGYLRIHLCPESLKERAACAYLARRISDFDWQAEWMLDYEPIKENECAGAAVMMDNDNHIRMEIRKEGSDRAIILIRCQKGIEEEIAREPIGEGKVLLRIVERDMKCSFYAQAGEETVTVAENIDYAFMSIEDADGFTGDTIGMYASSNGIESTAYADYEWFAYQAL